MAKTRNADDRGISSGRILLGGVVGIVLTLVLTFGAALALSRELLPLRACNWLGPLIIGLSAFFTAWTAARRNSKKLICGLLAAVLYGCGMMIAGLLLFSTPMQTGRLLLSMGALLLGGFGGVFSSGFAD